MSYAHQAPEVGLGTVKIAGTLGSQALVIPAGTTGTAPHVTLFVVSGTLFVENNGAAATADSFPVLAGTSYTVKNSAAMVKKLRIFSAAAVDVRAHYSE